MTSTPAAGGTWNLRLHANQHPKRVQPPAVTYGPLGCVLMVTYGICRYLFAVVLLLLPEN